LIFADDSQQNGGAEVAELSQKRRQKPAEYGQKAAVEGKNYDSTRDQSYRREKSAATKSKGRKLEQSESLTRDLWFAKISSGYDSLSR